MIQKIKGTQDFIDLKLFNFIIDEAKKHFKLYGFQEITTPILEPSELFKRSLGLHTEVVTKEMYTILDSKGEPSLCLRPEGTAPAMRAFLGNHITEKPWKIFSWGPMFRHERPQKGRYRQFHQITVENIGAESIAHDAEMISMLDSFFTEKLKLDDFALLINFLGSQEDRKKYKILLNNFLDKKQKDLPKKILELQKTNILRIFDLKDPDCQDALHDAPLILDHLSSDSKSRWEKLQQQLMELSVSYSV